MDSKNYKVQLQFDVVQSNPSYMMESLFVFEIFEEKTEWMFLGKLFRERKKDGYYRCEKVGRIWCKEETGWFEWYLWLSRYILQLTDEVLIVW